MRSKSKRDLRKGKNAKPQFSKVMCMRSWWLMALSVAVCLGGEFFLQYTARGSMREIVTVVLSLITFVTVFINGGYITQNIFRDTSLNKHGIYLDEYDGRKYYMTKLDSEYWDAEG